MILKTRWLKTFCLLLPCVLLLAACQTTRFQSRPSGAYSDCDPAWVGSWQVTQQQAGGNVDQLGTLDIPAGCQPITAHESGKPSEGFDDYTFSYARVGPLRLLVGSENTDKAPVDKHADKAPGLLVFRFEASPQRITVYGIDHALVARRIVDGTLPGHTEATSQVHPGQKRARTTSIDNLIEGDGDTIAALLQGEPTLFSAQPVLMLRRVPAGSVDP